MLRTVIALAALLFTLAPVVSAQEERCEGAVKYTLDDNLLAYSHAISADGKRIAVGLARSMNFSAAEARIKVYELPSMTLLHTLAYDPHRVHVRGLALNSDGSQLLSTCGNTSVLRDVASGRVIKEFASFGGGYRSAQFSPDDKLLVVAGKRKVVIYELRRGNETSIDVAMADPPQCGFTPDGKTIVANTTGGVWTYDLRRGRQKTELAPASAKAFTFTPDGKRIVVLNEGISVRDTRRGNEQTSFLAAGRFIAATDEFLAITQTGSVARVDVYGLESGALVHSFLWPGDTGEATRIEALPDGSGFIVSSGMSVTRCSLDVVRANLASAPTSIDGGHGGGITFITAMPGEPGRFVTVGNRKLNIWSEADRKVVQTVPVPASVTRVVFSDDGTHALLIGDGPFELRTVADWKVVRSFEGPAGEKLSAGAVNGDASRVGVASGSKLWVYDATSGARTHNFTYTIYMHGPLSRAVAFSPDGKLVACAPARGELNVWSLETSQRLHGITTKDNGVFDVRFESDTSLIVADNSGIAHITLGSREWRQTRAFKGVPRLAGGMQGVSADRKLAVIVESGETGRQIVVDLESGATRHGWPRPDSGAWPSWHITADGKSMISAGPGDALLVYPIPE